MTSRAASSDRLSHARKAVADAGLGALLLTPGPDLRWLTGYEALPLERLTCLVLPSDGEPFLVAPGLEVPAVQASGGPGLGVEVLGWGETEDPFALIAARVGRVGSVGLANRMWAEQVLRFRAALPGAEQSLASAVLADLRMRKSPDEVEALRRAGQAIDRVHSRMAEFLRPGRTERAAGREIAAAILAEGHETVDFVIVGSGPNGATPHHEVGDRVIEVGDAGGRRHRRHHRRGLLLGLHPDVRPRRAARGVPRVLRRAARGTAGCVRAGPARRDRGVGRQGRPGRHRRRPAAARSSCTAPGHGIGLETHEEPYIVEGNQTVLEPGMAFSIEPGIYLAGRHGARIEDIVVATDDGIERLNVTDRDLVVLEG